MEITFLGTGAGIPSKERNVSAILVTFLQELNTSWLFDCGEATQHQILHTSIKPRKISKIFITHLHGDHIFGLPGLLSSRSFLGGNDPLTIYGPKGIQEFVETSLRVSESHLPYTIHFEELHEGVLYEDEFVTVACTALQHNIKSYGFNIIEKERLGELKVEQLKDLGIKPGPIYREIKEQESVTMEDGTVLYRKDFIGPNKPGRKLTVFGDTTYVPALSDFISGADLLIHEATFDKAKKSLAKDYGHATTAQAAQLALDSKAKRLLLTHISSRYQGAEINELLKEAQAIFPDTAIAHDFFTYTLDSHS